MRMFIVYVSDQLSMLTCLTTYLQAYISDDHAIAILSLQSCPMWLTLKNALCEAIKYGTVEVAYM